MLALALTQYEDSLCSCGYPRHICQDPENDGEFDVEQVVCYAQAAIDSHTGAADYKPEPGERLGAVFMPSSSAFNSVKQADHIPGNDESQANHN